MTTGVCFSLGLYFLVLILLTYLASSKKSSDFLRASNEITWKGMSISLFASMFSSYNLVVGLTFSYMFGPWVLLIYFGALMAFYVIYILIKKQRKDGIDDKRFNSIIDYVNKQFGRKNAKIVNFTLIFILFIFIALQFFVNTTIFYELIGWNKYLSTIFVGAIVLLYTIIAGLKVEIYTDIFQGILMFLFLGLLFFVDTSTITVSAVKPILTDTTVIIGAISFAVAQFLTVLVQPEMWQRYYAVKSNKQIRKGIFVAYGLILIFIIPIIVIGLSAYTAGGVENPQNLFYDILETSTPKQYLPVISVAMFAAFMSSIDSSLFAISSQISKYGLFRKRKPQKNIDENNEKKEVYNTRVAIVIVSILAMIMSLFFSNLIIYVIQLVSLATVLSVVIIYSIVRKISQKVVFMAFITGIIGFVIFAYGGVINDNPASVLYPSFLTLLFLIISEIVQLISKSKVKENKNLK